MVKNKGFTLIEVMIVFAIIFILISVAVGPAKDAMDAARNNPNTVDSGAVDFDDGINTPTVINGVPHYCDPLGKCEPMD